MILIFALIKERKRKKTKTNSSFILHPSLNLVLYSTIPPRTALYRVPDSTGIANERKSDFRRVGGIQLLSDRGGRCRTPDCRETTARQRGESTEGRQEDGRLIPYVRSGTRRGGAAEWDAGAPAGTSPGGTKGLCLRGLTEPGPAAPTAPAPAHRAGRAAPPRTCGSASAGPGRAPAAHAEPGPRRAPARPALPRARPPLRGAPGRRAGARAGARAELGPAAPTCWAGPAAATPGERSPGTI